MSTKAYLVTSGALFGVIAVVQAIRWLKGWPVDIGTWSVPLWLSAIAVVIAASFSVWAFRLAFQGRRKRE